MYSRLSPGLSAAYVLGYIFIFDPFNVMVGVAQFEIVDFRRSGVQLDGRRWFNKTGVIPRALCSRRGMHPRRATRS